MLNFFAGAICSGTVCETSFLFLGILALAIPIFLMLFVVLLASKLFVYRKQVKKTKSINAGRFRQLLLGLIITALATIVALYLLFITGLGVKILVYLGSRQIASQTVILPTSIGDMKIDVFVDKRTPFSKVKFSTIVTEINGSQVTTIAQAGFDATPLPFSISKESDLDCLEVAKQNLKYCTPGPSLILATTAGKLYYVQKNGMTARVNIAGTRSNDEQKYIIESLKESKLKDLRNVSYKKGPGPTFSVPLSFR